MVVRKWMKTETEFIVLLFALSHISPGVSQMPLYTSMYIAE